MGSATGAQTQLPRVILTDAESSRVNRYVARVGVGAAIKSLGVSEATLDAARHQGRMRASTRERILATLTTLE